MTRISPGAKTDTGKDAKKNTKELKTVPQEKKKFRLPPIRKRIAKRKRRNNREPTTTRKSALQSGTLSSFYGVSLGEVASL
jgi:hypothetical protein